MARPALVQAACCCASCESCLIYITNVSECLGGGAQSAYVVEWEGDIEFSVGYSDSCSHCGGSPPEFVRVGWLDVEYPDGGGVTLNQTPVGIFAPHPCVWASSGSSDDIDYENVCGGDDGSVPVAWGWSLYCEEIGGAARWYLSFTIGADLAPVQIRYSRVAPASCNPPLGEWPYYDTVTATGECVNPYHMNAWGIAYPGSVTLS